MPNQRDVARLADVSTATVSRFLTNPDAVKQNTAHRVEKAIIESGYRVNESARILRTGRSYHIGILFPGIGPFYWETLQGIQNHLTCSGYFSTIFYSRDIDNTIHSSREKLSSFLNNKMVEGVIYFPLKTAEDAEILKKLRHFHKHLIIADQDMNDNSMDQVFIDNYQAGRTAATVLLEEGHEELIFIHGMETSYAATERRKGFQDSLKEAKIPWCEERIIFGDYTSTTAYNHTRKHLPLLPPFTGVFAVNDASAIGFLRAAGEQGLRCPQDFSLIGFDNNEEFTPYTSPSLSTFQQPLSELGSIASARIIEKIENETPPRTTILQTEFIRRESLGEAPRNAPPLRQIPKTVF